MNGYNEYGSICQRDSYIYIYLESYYFMFIIYNRVH
jgi:hypothetical protein